MRKREYKANWCLRIAMILLCLTMASTYMVAGMYARYSVTASASDQARTAAYVFEVKVDNEESVVLDLSDIRKPGDSKTVTLKLSNHSGAVSEVDQNYILTISELGSLPLTYTLNGQRIKNKEEKTGTLQASVGKDVDYTLVVTWPEGENDPKYASGSGAATVRLNIIAEQIV